MSPIPSPASIDPTNAKAGEDFRKKKPTPMPRSTPPPIAQVLLSSLLFVMVEILNCYINLVNCTVFI